MAFVRADGRGPTDIRTIKIESNYIKWAEGSCLISLGDTRVICTASILDSVPNFAKEKKMGWIFAEYSMLPRAVDTRTARSQSGRSYELQRIIGRSLRAAVDLTKIPGIAVAIDCDVIQADGSTRCASIVGGFIAMCQALYNLWKNKRIESFPVKRIVSAVSCGILKGHKIVDLTYKEDSEAQCDITVVATDKGEIVEVQGGVENGGIIKLEDFYDLLSIGLKAMEKIVESQRAHLGEIALEIDRAST